MKRRNRIRQRGRKNDTALQNHMQKSGRQRKKWGPKTRALVKYWLEEKGVDIRARQMRP